jgi:hypothetical protein
MTMHLLEILLYDFRLILMTHIFSFGEEKNAPRPG